MGGFTREEKYLPEDISTISFDVTSALLTFIASDSNL